MIGIFVSLTTFSILNNSGLCSQLCVSGRRCFMHVCFLHAHVNTMIVFFEQISHRIVILKECLM